MPLLKEIISYKLFCSTYLTSSNTKLSFGSISRSVNDLIFPETTFLPWVNPFVLSAYATSQV